MAVADQNVGPAVVVHVKKTAAPSQILGVRAQSGRESGVFKIAVAEVVIERGRVACEVGLYDIEIAVHIVIRRRNAHARLRLAVRTQRATRLQSDVYELSIFLVLVKGAGRGIVGDVDVGPAVVVEISGEDSQAKGSIGLQNSEASETSVKVPSPLLW